MAITLEDLAARIDALTLVVSKLVPVEVVPSFDPELHRWPVPSKSEYEAGAALPKATDPNDLATVYRLARVGRAPDGSVRRGYDALMACYDEIARLEKGEVSYFTATGWPPSWGAQQMCVLLAPQGWEYQTPTGAFGSSSWKPADFAGKGMADIALYWFAGGLANVG